MLVEQVLGHDIELDLEADAVVIDVVVLVRAQSPDGDLSIGVQGASEHTDEVVRMGMLHHAQLRLDHHHLNG